MAEPLQSCTATAQKGGTGGAHSHPHCTGVSGSTFTFTNKCDYTVWPGIQSNSNSPSFETTGFELEKGDSRSFQAPTGWGGRFWGRTGCNFDDASSTQAKCATGDCATGQPECNGNGASLPVTLAEFTLGGSGGQDFYDVSLVDGYNIQMVIQGSGGSGACAITGCIVDLNRQCPAELRVGDGEACRSACDAFRKPEFCCTGEYANSNTCRPTVYSEMFKSACPKSYSYAFDDATSTFTCVGGDYEITFCPSGTSQKSSKDSPRPTLIGTGSGTTGTGSGSSSSAAGVMLADDSYLASLATGDARRAHFVHDHHQTTFIALAFLLLAISLLL
ncbi:Thaumatin-like protein 1 [Asimina triloba]